MNNRKIYGFTNVLHIMYDENNFGQVLNYAVELTVMNKPKDALFFYKLAINLLPEPYKSKAKDIFDLQTQNMSLKG